MTLAVYGPLGRQFTRVLARLPRDVRRAHTFRWVDTLGGESVVTADAHILWSRFASHQLQNAILSKINRDRSRLWLTTTWSVEAVLALLHTRAAGATA